MVWLEVRVIDQSAVRRLVFEGVDSSKSYQENVLDRGEEGSILFEATFVDKALWGPRASSVEVEFWDSQICGYVGEFTPTLEDVAKLTMLPC